MFDFESKARLIPGTGRGRGKKLKWRENSEVFSKVCHKMAEQAISQRNFDGAIRSYKEALQFHPDDDVALINLVSVL